MTVKYYLISLKIPSWRAIIISIRSLVERDRFIEKCVS